MDEVHSVSLFGEITCLNAPGADVFVFALDTLHAFKTRDPYFGLRQNDCSDHKSIISKMLLKVKFALLAAANQAIYISNILIRIDITVICIVVSNYNIAAHHSDEFLTCTI